jgi:hypothetical protein
MGADHRRTRISAPKMLGACLMLGVVALGTPMAAVATPTVTLNPAAVPIPKNLLAPHSHAWPHTGDMAGAGAELEAHFTITGTEYEGLPAPLRHIAFYLPKGTVIHTSGFGRCKHPALVPRKQPPCSIRSLASEPGPEAAMANFGGTDVPTDWEQGAFFPVGGTLGFWTHSTDSPFDGGGYNSGSLGPTTGAYSDKMTETMPIRTAVSPLYDISTVSLDLTLGAAYTQGGKLISVLTLPKTCPASGWPVKAELSFGAGAQSTWETVTLTSKEPCHK